MHFKPGAVILAKVFFKDADPGTFKTRPVLVISFQDNFYTVAPITGTNKSNICLGKWIIKDSATGVEMGLKKDSFINMSGIINIPVIATGEKIGQCLIFKELIGLLKSGSPGQQKIF
jgi:hypothetical protein